MKTHYHLIKDLCPLKTTLSLVKLHQCSVLLCIRSTLTLELPYLFVKVRICDLSVDWTNFINAVELWTLHKQTEHFFPGTSHIVTSASLALQDNRILLVHACQVTCLLKEGNSKEGMQMTSKTNTLHLWRSRPALRLYGKAWAGLGWAGLAIWLIKQMAHCRPV